MDQQNEQGSSKEKITPKITQTASENQDPSAEQENKQNISMQNNKKSNGKKINCKQSTQDITLKSFDQIDNNEDQNNLKWISNNNGKRNSIVLSPQGITGQQSQNGLKQPLQSQKKSAMYNQPSQFMNSGSLSQSQQIQGLQSTNKSINNVKYRLQKQQTSINNNQSNQSVDLSKSVAILSNNNIMNQAQIQQNSTNGVSQNTTIIIPKKVIVNIPVTFYFALELFLRIISYNAFGETFKEFMKKPFSLIDISIVVYASIEIIFFIFGMQISMNFRCFRALLVLRLIRLFKFEIFNEGIKVLMQGLTESSEALAILSFFTIICVILISSFMYFLEKEYTDTDKYKIQIKNIPEGIWWTIITITTVGYGDTVPLSIPGQMIACLALIFGVLLLSLPVAIIGNKFQEFYVNSQKKNRERERFQTKKNYINTKDEQIKEIYQMMVKMEELEEINENIESTLKENQFLYRSMLRQAQLMIDKLDLKEHNVVDDNKKDKNAKQIKNRNQYTKQQSSQSYNQISYLDEDKKKYDQQKIIKKIREQIQRRRGLEQRRQSEGSQMQEELYYQEQQMMFQNNDFIKENNNYNYNNSGQKQQLQQQQSQYDDDNIFNYKINEDNEQRSQDCSKHQLANSVKQSFK